MVIVSNEASTQIYQGIAWYGTKMSPLLTILQGQPGDKPITVQGYDIIASENKYVAYGDKKLLRYGLDLTGGGNSLLFFGLLPLAAEVTRARWLVRQQGDMVSNEGILRMAKYIKALVPSSFYSWCTLERDLFSANTGYVLYDEIPKNIATDILKAAHQNTQSVV